jgi:hypothetical protein
MRQINLTVSGSHKANTVKGNGPLLTLALDTQSYALYASSFLKKLDGALLRGLGRDDVPLA